jgi:serine/threonine-protein kinase
MEYLEGRSLKERIVAEGPLPIASAIEIARQILRAVGFAHRRQIVHRDIKPHNVLLVQDGPGDGDERFKVTDFGISRTATSQMTEAGSIVGTAQYLSPEQARGAPVDQRSDIYSVGIVLYELLTGQLPFTGETPLEIAMKHLSEIPRAPSELRPELPTDLDMIVLRALAKDPADRFESAEEMERELARVAGGGGVTTETAEAATAVLAGAGLAEAAPTMISRRPVVAPRETYDDHYYDYEEPPRRRRPLWPWLLAILLAAGAIVAGFYIWDRIQDELNATKPVAVPLVEGMRKPLAEKAIRDAGLKPRAINRSHLTVPVGEVFAQDPDAGERIQKGNAVRIFVSTGKPRVNVPDVLGAREADAIATIRAAGLIPNPVEIFSDDPQGSVIAQDPKGGTGVVRGSTVRINISKGQQTTGLPNVIGLSYDSAADQLRRAGFTPSRKDVDSSEPKGTVIEMDPSPGSLQPPGTKITVTVSKGQATSAIPDVTGIDEASAQATLENEGWKVSIRDTPTQDPAEDGIVLDQAPSAGEQAKPGAKVTLFVGRLEQASPPPPAPTPPPPPPGPPPP